MLERYLDRFFKPLENLPLVEASTGDEESLFQLHVVPVEEFGTWPWEAVFDTISLHTQAWLKKHGVNSPDIRLRVIYNPESDGIEGHHFGTLTGATEKARRLELEYVKKVVGQSEDNPVEGANVIEGEYKIVG